MLAIQSFRLLPSCDDEKRSHDQYCSVHFQLTLRTFLSSNFLAHRRKSKAELLQAHQFLRPDRYAWDGGVALNVN